MTTTPTLTLAEFVLARVAEDEATARASVADAERNPGPIPPSWVKGVAARVLAECAAKRAIVALIALAIDGVEKGGVFHSDWDIACHLAAVYADHEDYREEWRP